MNLVGDEGFTSAMTGIRFCFYGFYALLKSHVVIFPVLMFSGEGSRFFVESIMSLIIWCIDFLSIDCTF